MFDIFSRLNDIGFSRMICQTEASLLDSIQNIGSSIRIPYIKLFNLKLNFFALQRHTLLFRHYNCRFSSVVCPNGIVLRCSKLPMPRTQWCCPSVNPLFLRKITGFMHMNYIDTLQNVNRKI